MFAQGAPRQTLPIRQLSDRYEGEWLLVKVLDPSVPVGDALGEVLAHSRDWNEVFKANRKARKHDPTAILWIVHSGTRFGDGEALRHSLARIAREDEWTSVNRW